MRKNLGDSVNGEEIIQALRGREFNPLFINYCMEEGIFDNDGWNAAYQGYPEYCPKGLRQKYSHEFMYPRR